MPTAYRNRRMIFSAQTSKRFKDKYSVPFEMINEAVRLDPETGRLFWKVRPHSSFKTPAIADAWNKKYAGKEAFTALDGAGYRCGRVLGFGYQAHYIVWMLHTGAWPEFRMDHINGCISDNRPINLRDVDQAENARNRAIPITNKSGVIGVYYHVKRQSWVASIRGNGTTIRLGVFKELEEAIAARKEAETLYGYHPNHGRRRA